MVSENLGLLTCEQFIEARDTIALASMLERGEKLFNDREDAWLEVRRLRKELSKHPAPKSGLQYDLTPEQFRERIRLINIRDRITSELDDAYREWAAAEADMCDILNDQRYKDHAAKQLAETA